MNQDNSIAKNNVSALRYGMFVPLAFLIASVISCCFSYSNAKKSIAIDLNDAMLAMAEENSELWTRPDTIAAIRQMYETTRKPLIFQASDVNFRNAALKDEAYFTLSLIDKKNPTHNISGNRIASDSILLVPESAADGFAIQVQGFADCSMASIFNVSDQTFPGILFSLSIISMISVFIWRRKNNGLIKMKTEAVSTRNHPLDGVKLTPMQRQFAQMLLDAPNMRVEKSRLCEALWGNKSNAEESLYTLVRRTKTAIAKTDIEIVCNRGESYELRVNG